MDFPDLDLRIKEALREDLGRGDLTTTGVLRGAATLVEGRVLARQSLVMAGWPLFLRVFGQLGEIEAEVLHAEGSQVEAGLMGTLRGSARVLLSAERVALNLLQRTCGIATRTRHLVELTAGTGVKVLDTRKTTPLWRAVEKYCVVAGGGFNHRFGLDDAVLIKENHIALAGGIKQAVENCRSFVPHLHKIEVEVRNLEELDEALETGCEAILLDNMSVEEATEAVARVAGRCLLEVSGGIDESNIRSYAETGVDFISVGALTHSTPASDISLLIEPALAHPQGTV